MFSGIIEVLGTVHKRTEATLAVKARLAKPRLGASIAVNGVCLTVIKSAGDVHSFDVGPDTWKRTNLGALSAGDAVNVEPSLRLGDEVSGHFVPGHVDAAARLLALEPWEKDFYRLRLELPAELRGLVAVKGSVAVDGVSLTVTAVRKDDFEIMLVPHTLSATTLGARKPGDLVNLEADPLARYAKAAAAALTGARLR